MPSLHLITPQLRRHEKKLQRIANELICGGSGGGVVVEWSGVEWEKNKKKQRTLEIFKERAGDTGLKAINPGQPEISPLSSPNPLPTAASSDRKGGNVSSALATKNTIIKKKKPPITQTTQSIFSDQHRSNVGSISREYERLLTLGAAGRPDCEKSG